MLICGVDNKIEIEWPRKSYMHLTHIGQALVVGHAVSEYNSVAPINNHMIAAVWCIIDILQAVAIKYTKLVSCLLLQH